MRSFGDISFTQQTTQMIYAARWVEENLVPMKEFDVMKEFCNRREFSVTEA
jgi:hypothetical protein